MAGGPYEVLMDTLAESGTHNRLDVAGVDDRPAPWESSMQATCDALARRGALETLERRHAEDDLGETVYGRFPPNARSAVVTAHLLLEKGVISEEELRAKMHEVRARFERIE